jgi:hypothetical protein
MPSTQRYETNDKKSHKYSELGDYLKNSSNSVEQLTYEEIEDIVKTKLPTSAYQYKPWWSNSGQPHSKIWSNAGWKVSSINLGQSITFKKNNIN